MPYWHLSEVSIRFALNLKVFIFHCVAPIYLSLNLSLHSYSTTLLDYHRLQPALIFDMSQERLDSF